VSENQKNQKNHRSDKIQNFSYICNELQNNYAMTTISSKEFATHQDRYFDMAINDDVRIKRRRNMFRLVYEPIVEQQAVLEPDDDLRSAITGDELMERMRVSIHKFFADKK